jgi:hypothetical protein
VRMPGLTAETSLYTSTERHNQQVVTLQPPVSAAIIWPAANCVSDDGDICRCSGKCSADGTTCSCHQRF